MKIQRGVRRDGSPGKKKKTREKIIDPNGRAWYADPAGELFPLGKRRGC